ncbi:hypothetical protein C483_15911 [Natrialba hulunbeirensis JCM 10989]|uniref:Uncharacterized protein n=1 Tax=Natrialba hulunbeirensis JCM 10989 TaxID=1227493 RepID=L9ZSQ3_9EURY|nr:hypothetical protein C483_15911 [Natrialba hulunbeirensis JCM 10989]
MDGLADRGFAVALDSVALDVPDGSSLRANVSDLCCLQVARPGDRFGSASAAAEDGPVPTRVVPAPGDPLIGRMVEFVVVLALARPVFDRAVYDRASIDRLDGVCVVPLVSLLEDPEVESRCVISHRYSGLVTSPRRTRARRPLRIWTERHRFRYSPRERGCIPILPLQ